MVDNNHDDLVKKEVMYDMDSIQVPEGLKEEIWNNVKPYAKPKKKPKNWMPILAAAACIAILIPIALSIYSNHVNRHSAQSPVKNNTVAKQNNQSPKDTLLNQKVFQKQNHIAKLATSIPKNANYLEVEFADKNKKQVGVMVGHPLTSQGTGFKVHGPVFYQKGNYVTVYIPLGVVFGTGTNSIQLFSYFPPAIKPIPKNPTSVWLLMYGNPTSNYVMTGGTLNTNDLASWNIMNYQKQVKNYLIKAKQNGWRITQKVDMTHNLTGMLGHNGWAKIPMGVPVNLVDSGDGGNEIFEIHGVISEKQLLKEHPQLKKGIEATRNSIHH